MSTKIDILGKKIKDIYYSEEYSQNDFAVFVDLEDDIRFRLNGWGVSYADVNREFNDLYSINPKDRYDEVYKNAEIIEVVDTVDNNWAYLKLDNGFEIGVTNDFLDRCLNLGRFKWTPDDDFFRTRKNAPKLSSDKLKYEDIINYFKQFEFGSNMSVLTHLSILYPSDRVEILKRVMDNGAHNLYIYDKLSMAYAKNGNPLLAYNILLVGNNNGVIDDFNFEAMKLKIGNIRKTQNLDLQTQMNYIKENINTPIFVEELFLIHIKDFIEKNYLQHRV